MVLVESLACTVAICVGGLATVSFRKECKEINRRLLVRPIVTVALRTHFYIMRARVSNPTTTCTAHCLLLQECLWLLCRAIHSFVGSPAKGDWSRDGRKSSSIVAF